MFNRIIQIHKLPSVGIKIYGIEIRKDISLKSIYLVIHCGEKEICIGLFK